MALCYTFIMQQPTDWTDWISFLRRWKVSQLTMTLIDQFQPLLPLASQVVTFSLPLLMGVPLGEKLRKVGALLDDPTSIAQLIDQLKEDCE